MKPRKSTGYGDRKQVREGGGRSSSYQVVRGGFFSKVSFKLRPETVQDTSPRSHWQACFSGCQDIFSARKQAGKGTHGRDWMQVNEHSACLAVLLSHFHMSRKSLVRQMQHCLHGGDESFKNINFLFFKFVTNILLDIIHLSSSYIYLSIYPIYILSTIYLIYPCIYWLKASPCWL